MCVIVSKARGVAMPSKDILQNCFNRNSDGAGLMYVNNGKVVIRKGFMNFKDFYEYVEKLDHTYDMKEKALVMHFRISTGGNVDGGNCHPYPITSDEKRLRETMVNTTLGMAHNGIISDYSRKDKVLNDTQCFVRDCVSLVHDYDNEFYKNERTMNMLKDIAGSKLCFLDTNEEIYYVGDFIEEDGVMYSNTTYKSYISYPILNGYYYGKKSKNYDFDVDDYYYGMGYGYGSEYDDYYDKLDEEDELEMYDSIIGEKVLKEKGCTKPLTLAEFNLCMENIEILDKGTKIDSVDGTFIVPDGVHYGIDSWFNLYYIDYGANDIYVLFEDVYITYNLKKSDDTEPEDIDEVGANDGE